MKNNYALKNITKSTVKYLFTGLFLIYSYSVLAMTKDQDDLQESLQQRVAGNTFAIVIAQNQNTRPPADAETDITPKDSTTSTDNHKEDSGSQESQAEADGPTSSTSADQGTDPVPDNENEIQSDPQNSTDPATDTSNDDMESSMSQTEASNLPETDNEEGSGLPADEDQQPADDSNSEEEPQQAASIMVDRKNRKIERGKTEVQAETEYATTFYADNPVFEKEEFTARIKSFTNYGITENINILLDLDLVFDGEKELLSQSNRFLDREGLNVDKIFIEYRNDWLSLFGGRYEPGYGLFPNTPAFFGNYSHYIDLSEKLGFGGAVKLGETSEVEHWLTTNVFQLDTSFLSSPLFTNKGRIEKEDGGISNTEKFDNYLVTLNGGKAYAKPGASYTLGYGLQRAGVDRDLDEEMFIGGLYGHITPSEDYDINLALEHVNLQNAGGFPEDHSTITLGAFYSRWPWGIGTVYSQRSVNPHDASEDGRTDKIFEIVGRYFFGDHIGLETAIEVLNENGEDEQLFGIVFVYYFDKIPHFKYK
ncbi:MAG TPA: hypothetical protein EYH06_13095 [Chromatiales bacterium]|nr:hypothetical protein [Thiotrichales bacterium]HIP69499.1 hypothetical protein [Chromatiales bacterium]